MTETTPIFVLSLPRSGSTLLQRLIATSDAVATAPEPWVLLPQLYALRDGGVVAEYDQALYREGMRGFLELLPGGVETYRAELRRFALALYGAASGEGKRYFVDKTPRYSLVAEELFALFPDAKYVFLFRQPLAVAASAVETFAHGRWSIHRWQADLYTGLANLVEAHRHHSSSSLTVRYEELVAEPEKVLRDVGSFLDLDLDPGAVSRLPAWAFASPLGDPTGTYSYDHVSTEPTAKWKTVLAPPVRRAWARRYLQWIGRDRIAELGYDFDLLSAELEALPTRLNGSVSDAMGVARGRLLSGFDKLPRSWH